MGDILKWLAKVFPFIKNKLIDSTDEETKRYFGNDSSSIIENASSLLGDKVGNYLDSFLNKETQAGPTGVMLHQEERDDTAFQRQVADMQAAGLNPAMMFGGSPSPVVNTSAAAAPGAGISDLLQLAMLPLQMKSLQADIDKTKADTDNTKAQTKGFELSNAWIDREKQAKIDSQRSGIELNDSRISEINQGISESKVRIDKLISETNEVEERTRLEVSQRLLNQANAKRIEELLPFEKLLLDAKTTAEVASAEQAFANAAYQNGLISNGIIEFTAQKLQAEGVVAEVKAQLADDKYHTNEDTVVDKVCRTIIAGLRRTVMLVSGK